MVKPRQMLTLAGLAAASLLNACATAGNAPSTLAELPPFREASVAVFDDQHVAVFKAERAYALEVAGNEESQAFEVADQMVRITPDGRPGLWLRCADLAPGLPGCSGAVAEAANLSRSLPACPGDPRCPRRNPAGK